MATVTLKGNLVTVAGKLPRKGEGVSDFSLTGRLCSTKTTRFCIRNWCRRSQTSRITRQRSQR